MSILKKIAATAMVSLALAQPATASPSLLVALPEIGVLTADLARWIADEFAVFAKLLPVMPRTRQVAVVTILDGANTVAVAKSDGSVTVIRSMQR
jgi:hypothetical protein